MSRASTVNLKHIEYRFWLIFDASGSMRMARKAPSTSRDERAMFCTARLPKNLFQVPTLRATIVISDQGEPAFSFNVEAASEALRQTLGVDIDLQVKHEGAE